MNILIADDRPTNLKVLRVTLKAEGHRVLEASDGLEALQILKREKIDLVISDILMPNLDGYRLCYEIRNDPHLLKTPIILYSSTYLSPSDRKLAIDFGANGFLEKPAPAEELIRVIERVCGGTVPAPVGSAPEDLKVLKQYSERLIKKIEEKNIELAQRTEQLEEVHEKFRQMAQSIREVFWMASREMNQFLYLSPAFQTIWGRAARDVYESPDVWLDAIVPEDRPAVVRAAASERYAADAGYEEEFRIVRPDGAIRWIHNRRFPIRDASGRVFRVTGVATDVTDRKTLEDQMRQAQKMEVIGRLAGGVAHDFNNLLTPIVGYSQLMLEQLGPADRFREELEEIATSGKRAADLTRQLLAFSRKQVLQPKVVDLNQVVSGTQKLLRRLIGEDVRLELRLAPQIGRVKVDPGQLEQVIMNLAVNARDSMPQGGDLVIATADAILDEAYAKTYSEVTPGLYSSISVSDTGTGMDKETLSHLFEPFFTTKPKGKGTGLGLATVFGIVKQSRGHVSVTSELGHGSTFRIYFPRVDETIDREEATSAPRVADSGREMVLLVEDDPTLRIFTAKVLRLKGYKVLEAASGEEALALDKAAKVSIHLILTDVVMTGINGREAARQIAQGKPGIKILYMSGYTDDAILQHGVLDPSTYLLQKPFTAETLARKVREILDCGNPGT